jgi:hypothetical protein
VRQTAQSGDDLGSDAKEDARVNIGSASINASVLMWSELGVGASASGGDGNWRSRVEVDEKE